MIHAHVGAAGAVDAVHVFVVQQGVVLLDEIMLGYGEANSLG